MPFPHEQHASPLWAAKKWDDEPRRLQNGKLVGNPLCSAICFSKKHDSSNHFKPWGWCETLGYCRPRHLLFRLYSPRNFEGLGYNYKSVPVIHHLAPGPGDENPRPNANERARDGEAWMWDADGGTRDD